jgi:hypothetical protein
LEIQGARLFNWEIRYKTTCWLESYLGKWLISPTAWTIFLHSVRVL